jgi:hypothetical protein
MHEVPESTVVNLAELVADADPLGGGATALQAVLDDAAGLRLVGVDMANRAAG